MVRCMHALKQTGVFTLFLYITCLLSVSCTSSPASSAVSSPPQDTMPETYAMSWSLAVKEAILQHANLPADSVMRIEGDEHQWRVIYLKGAQKTREYWINNFDTTMSVHYSSTGEFDMVRKLFPHTGQVEFECLRYNEKYFGLSIYNYPDGRLHEQGFHYEDLAVGLWKEFDKQGKLVQETDRGNGQSLKGLRDIPCK